jgi:hypothetical protein
MENLICDAIINLSGTNVIAFASLKEKNLVFGIEIYSYTENEILRNFDWLNRQSNLLRMTN